VLRVQIDNIRGEIRKLDRHVEAVRSDIRSHHYYSSEFDRLSIEFENLAKKLNRIDGQLGLSKNFENALTEQRDYWRKVTLSYETVKNMVRHFMKGYILYMTKFIGSPPNFNDASHKY
jgi:hypothetical protein